MKDELSQAVESFLRRSPDKGVFADLNEISRLNTDLGGIIPSWYISLVTTFPICGIELGWQVPTSNNSENSICYLQWFGPDAVRSEMLDCYPGIALRHKGYLCVAGCSHGSGDQYYIPTDHANDPPLYQIAHDMPNDPDVILRQGRCAVVPRLSQLFLAGVT